MLLISSTVWSADNATQQFQQWTGERLVTREMSLASLGFTSPAIFNDDSSSKEFYLPVPSAVPLSDAAIKISGRYLRADGGRTSMTVAIDGYPVAAHRFTEDEGDASMSIGVDGLPRTSGFVRLGVNWTSILSDQVCTDNRTPANSLRIAANSSFSYRYDRNAITTLRAAWSALPPEPRVLIESKLSASDYDTVWRIGMVLQRSGKHTQFITLPGIGDTIDLSDIDIPATLKNIPAFAALSGHETQHHIQDAAELGALIALGEHGPLQADLVITNAALLSHLHVALEALRTQIQQVSPTGETAYSNWITNQFTLLNDNPEKNQIRLSRFGATPTITIPAEVGEKAAVLLGTLWRDTAVNNAVTVNQALKPQQDGEVILLSQFGTINGSMDVLAHATRSVSFDLGAVAGDGRVPASVAFDLSAAPSINGEAPVASIFFNDYLLSATRLNADGRPQRISADIPRHMLASRNELRIAFYRQPTQVRCHDRPTAFPVSILPGSHLRLGKTTLSDDFIGASGHYASPASLIIPETWLNTPSSSLPLLIKIANAVGFSYSPVDLQIAKNGQSIKPERPFLALDTAVDGYQSQADIHNGKLVIQDNTINAPILNLADLNHLATLEVIKSNAQTGIVYRTVGKQNPTLDSSFLVTQGNFALLGDSGLLLQVDTNDPAGAKLASESNPRSLWENYMTLWLILIAIIAFVLIAARVAHVRKNKRPASDQK